MAPPILEQNNKVSTQKTENLAVKTDPSIQALRNQARVDTSKEALKTIQNTKTTETSVLTTRNTLNARISQSKTQESIKHPRHANKQHGQDNAAETREQIAIRANQIRARNIAAKNPIARVGQGTSGQMVDPEALERNEKVGGLKNSLGQNVDSSIGQDTDIKISPDAASMQSRDATNSRETGLTSSTNLEPSIKLLELVGPQATLTFREKLQEVWVKLDESATKQLDVIARLPANLQGQTSRELLMVESPQGVHFVAFLKNKNDFEVLSSFDRRAMLPDSPARQLVEAGIHAYEQLDSVARGTGERLEQIVREKAQKPDSNRDLVLNELRKLCIQEKRRRSTFRRMVDYLVDRLDELDLMDQEAQDNEKQNYVKLGVEEKLAKDFGSEQKKEIDSAVSDNRPIGADEINFDDEDDENNSVGNNTAGNNTVENNTVENNSKVEQAIPSLSSSMASRAMGFTE